MDNRTLVVVGLSAGSIEFLTLLALAVYRKEKPLTLFALGFGGAAAGSLLLLGQGTLSPLFSVVLSNLLVSSLVFLLVAGFRAFFGMKPWPRRLTAYVASYAVSLLVFTFAVDGYAGRVAAYFVLLAVLCAEGFLLFLPRRPQIPGFLRATALAVCVLMAISQAVRLALVVLVSADRSSLIEDTVATPGMLLGMLVSGILWTNLVLFTDSIHLTGQLRLSNRRLEALARTDELTGLLNRNAFEQLLLDGPSSERRRQGPVSLLLLDLDDFKRINDTYGHQAGDEALAGTADRIRRLVRYSDQVFRWGGEEFLVLAPGLPIESAGRLGERIRQAVETQGEDGSCRFTVSIGIAERREGEDKDAWFRRADQALYQAKNQGKNRVSVAT